MKKIVLTLLIITSICLTGCKSEQIKNGPSESNIKNENISNSSKAKDNIKPSDNSVTTSTIAPKDQYQLYKDEKGRFSIEFPSTFIPYVMFKENNDNEEITLILKNGGRIYTSSDGGTILMVGRDNNESKITAKNNYDELLIHHPNATYKKLNQNWFVLSWLDDDGKIVYVKNVVNSDGIYYFKIKYPSSEKATYDTIVSHINSSFIILSNKN